MPFYELPQSQRLWHGCGTSWCLRLPHGLESHLRSPFLPWKIPERYFTNAFFPQSILSLMCLLSPSLLPASCLHPTLLIFFLDPFPVGIFTCLRGTFLSWAFSETPFNLELPSAAWQPLQNQLRKPAFGTQVKFREYLGQRLEFADFEFLEKKELVQSHITRQCLSCTFDYLNPCKFKSLTMLSIYSINIYVMVF